MCAHRPPWVAGCLEAGDEEQNMVQEATTLLLLTEGQRNLLV